MLRWNSAISASFSALRWSCQTPSITMTATATSTSSVGISGQPPVGLVAGAAGSVIGVHLAALRRLSLVLARQQGAFADAQAIDDRRGGQRNPQDDIDPQGLAHGRIERQRDRDQQRADDQGEKGRGAIADIIAAIIE